NMDLLSNRMHQCFSIFNSTCTNKKLQKKTESKRHRDVITSDPYVTVSISGATVARTRVISNAQNPVWNEHFVVPLAHPVSELEFHVKDDDVFGADLIGFVNVSAARVMSGEVIDEWFEVLGSHGKPVKTDCMI
nr:phospholipase D delta-like [Tanacetum cinerariifolium]